VLTSLSSGIGRHLSNDLSGQKKSPLPRRAGIF
jgi:hypothetical protein